MVDCFRKAEDIVPIARDAVAKGARSAVDAARHPQRRGGAHRARRGLDVVMDRCVKIEHARILGGLNWAGVNTGVISARRPA